MGAQARACLALVVGCLLVLSGSLAAHAEERHLAGYQERIAIARDGSAQVTMNLTGLAALGGDGPVLLPLAHARAEGVTARAAQSGAPLAARARVQDGVDLLEVDPAPEGMPDAVEVSLRVPGYLDWDKAGPEEFDLYRAVSEFRNTRPMVIDSYRLDVVLPEGYSVHHFGKSVPAVTGESSLPPYAVRNAADGSHVSLSAAKLGIGKACSVEYFFLAGRPSLALPLAALVVALLYLVFFRDVLPRRAAHEEPAP